MYVVISSRIQSNFTCLCPEPSRTRPSAFANAQDIQVVSLHLFNYLCCFSHAIHCPIRFPMRSIFLELANDLIRAQASFRIVVVVVVVVVEYLESVIFLHPSHPLQILFFSVLFCTDDTCQTFRSCWSFLLSINIFLFISNLCVFQSFR